MVFQGHVCRGEFGANPADELTSVPCQTEVFFMMSERIRRAYLARHMCRGVFYVVGRRSSRLSEVVFQGHVSR